MEETNRERKDCGLCGFHPEWLQRFANTRSFLLVYGLLGTIQSMAYVYWVATLTTFEKRFRIPSKTTGIMLSGNEISQILLALFLSYYGGQRNRPLWIAWGVAFSAASCYVLALPHLLYGPGELALKLTEEYALHQPENFTKNSTEAIYLCSKEDRVEDCEMKVGGEFSKMPALLVFASQFILGIGTTLYYALGQTYIDDNTNKAKTPMYLGVTFSLRTVGPVFGFMFGYVCLTLYIDPTLTPLITNKDPRWLGAWWLGWLLLGSIMLLFAVFISMFPKTLRSTKERVEINENEITANVDKSLATNGVVGTNLTVKEEPKPPTMKEFPKAFSRLVKNNLLLTNIFSGIFYILGSSGYITYMTKYMEVQFNQTAAGASIIFGPITLISFIMGFLSSGYIISKFKPRPLYLFGWNVFVGCFFIIGELLFAMISCSDNNIVGYNFENNRIDMINECNQDCECINVKYAPVCLEEFSLTFYSPCHAGCYNLNKIENGMNEYGNCSCIPVIIENGSDNSEQLRYYNYNGVLKEGACPVHCGYNFIIFIITSCIIHTFGSSGKIGNVLVNYRAVQPEDKAFSQGLSLLLISLLAFIPGPIMFGAIIDSTCLIWDKSCNTKGNCWFYDKKAFRIKLNMTAAAFTTVGVALDAVVCYMGKDLIIYDDDDEQTEKHKAENIEKTTSKVVESDNEEGPLKYDCVPKKH